MTIVLVVPVTLALDFVGSAVSTFDIVNVVLVGVLITRPFSLNDSSSLQSTCTTLPICKSCATSVVTVATLLFRSIVVMFTLVNT